MRSSIGKNDFTTERGMLTKIGLTTVAFAAQLTTRVSEAPLIASGISSGETEHERPQVVLN